MDNIFVTRWCFALYDREHGTFVNNTYIIWYWKPAHALLLAFLQTYVCYHVGILIGLLIRACLLDIVYFWNLSIIFKYKYILCSMFKQTIALCSLNCLFVWVKFSNWNFTFLTSNRSDIWYTFLILMVIHNISIL